MSFAAKVTFTWQGDPQAGVSFQAFDEFQQLLYQQFMAGNVDVDSTRSDNGFSIIRLVKDVPTAEIWKDLVLALITKHNNVLPETVIEQL